MARRDPECRTGLMVQTILVDTSVIDYDDAKAWLDSHGFKTSKEDWAQEGQNVRFRQVDPEGFTFFRWGEEFIPGVKPLYACPPEHELKGPLMDEHELSDAENGWEPRHIDNEIKSVNDLSLRTWKLIKSLEASGLNGDIVDALWAAYANSEFFLNEALTEENDAACVHLFSLASGGFMAIRAFIGGLDKSKFGMVFL